MSDLFQIACPKCSTKMRVRRPSAEKASVTCTSCAAKFTFRVPPAVVAPQRSAPAPVDLGAFNFDGLPTQSTPIPTVASQRYRSTAPVGRGFQGATQEKSSKKTRKKSSAIGLTPIAIGCIFVAVIGLIGTAGYFAARKVPLLARSVSILDSVDAIAADADAADAELLQLTSSIGAAPDISVLEKRLEELSADSYKLVLRVVQTSTISEAKANAMQAQWQQNSKNIGQTEDRKDELIEQVKQLPNEQIAKWRFMVSHFARNHGFVRNYIRYGHLDLPKPTAEGERIVFEKLTLMRELNRSIAKLVQSMPVEKPGDVQTDEQIRDYLDALYAPIIGDLQRATDKMSDLAEQRFLLGESQLGDTKKYTEIEERVEAARTMVLTHGIVLTQKHTKTADAFGELFRAKGELDAAGYSHMPGRLAEATAKKQADEAALKNEQLEQSRLAQQAKDREERQRQDKLDRKAEVDATMSASPDTLAQNGTAGNSETSSMPAEGMSGFGPGRFQPGRFQPGRNRPGGRSPDAMDNTPNMSEPSFGPPPRSMGERPPPEFDPSTSITISMQNADGIDSREIMGKFGSLKAAVQVSIRNGSMIVRVGYAGSLQDVVSLIDFAKVVSTDGETRTIVIAPNE